MKITKKWLSKITLKDLSDSLTSSKQMFMDSPPLKGDNVFAFNYPTLKSYIFEGYKHCRWKEGNCKKNLICNKCKGRTILKKKGEFNQSYCITYFNLPMVFKNTKEFRGFLFKILLEKYL